jgi:hypothetical protein
MDGFEEAGAKKKKEGYQKRYAQPHNEIDGLAPCFRVPERLGHGGFRSSEPLFFPL